MRTNIDIDDKLMDSALKAGHFKTKKEAVEAGLALVARQAAFREVLKWEGKLHWDDSPLDLTQGGQHSAALLVMEPSATTRLVAKKAPSPSAAAS